MTQTNCRSTLTFLLGGPYSLPYDFFKFFGRTMWTLCVPIYILFFKLRLFSAILIELFLAYIYYRINWLLNNLH